MLDIVKTDLTREWHKLETAVQSIRVYNKNDKVESHKKCTVKLDSNEALKFISDFEDNFLIAPVAWQMYSSTSDTSKAASFMNNYFNIYTDGETENDLQTSSTEKTAHSTSIDSTSNRKRQKCQ